MFDRIKSKMARQKDESKRTQPRTVKIKRTFDGGTYKSQQAASKKWEEKNPQEKIILRVPAGMRDKINAYVEMKANENPNDRKYSTDKGRPSVNAMINTLIAEEMGETLS